MEGIESGGGSGVVSEDPFEVSRLRKGLKRNWVWIPGRLSGPGTARAHGWSW